MGAVKAALFVSAGNICRSPIAATVFHLTVTAFGESDKWEVDNATLEPWHVGLMADPRVINTLQSHVNTQDLWDVSVRKARLIVTEDFHKFDYIFAMDQNNMRALKQMTPADCKAKLLLLIAFDPNDSKEIQDPYCDNDDDGLELCYHQCTRACEAFLKSLSSL